MNPLVNQGEADWRDTIEALSTTSKGKEILITVSPTLVGGIITGLALLIAYYVITNQHGIPPDVLAREWTKVAGMIGAAGVAVTIPAQIGLLLRIDHVIEPFKVAKARRESEMSYQVVHDDRTMLMSFINTRRLAEGDRSTIRKALPRWMEYKFISPALKVELEGIMHILDHIDATNMPGAMQTAKHEELKKQIPNRWLVIQQMSLTDIAGERARPGTYADDSVYY